MGLFTRKDSAAAKKGDNGVRPRPSVSSEAQAAELRARARRRLAGSVVLVLAAVIILPMVLDSQPVPVAGDIPVSIPGRDTPYQPAVSEPQQGQQPQVSQQAPGSAPSSASAVTQPGSSTVLNPPPAEPVAPVTPASSNAPGTSGVSATSVTPATATAVTPVTTTTAATPATVRRASPPNPASDTPATPRPAARSDTKPDPKPPARSDDGAVALALLEGRHPATAASASASAANKKGGFALQVAAYGSQADAQARNDQLHEKGFTNAYVERINSGSKVLYRLRVGPFASREVAQAQQARLRALGYDATMTR